MNLKEFQKTTQSNFRGLYRRGTTDQVPPDHAADLSNLDFNKTGELFTRKGTVSSLSLSHPVKRMFLATIAPGNYYLLTYDGVNSIWIYDCNAGTDNVLYSDPNLRDFYAINEWTRCYILPAGNDFNHTMVMQVLYWYIDPSTGTGSLKFRPALGKAPAYNSTTPFTVEEFIVGVPFAGQNAPGTHKFAVSFVTDTGFSTRPGPVDATGIFYPAIVTSPGGGNYFDVSNIPIGPAGTVARQLYVTKADEEEYFVLAEGYINDNTTTSTPLPGLAFFDTDLTISADALFNLQEEVPGGATTSTGIFKYHGRTLVWGNQGHGTLVGGRDATSPDIVSVSKAGEPEAFDNVAGLIQIPSETDGNYVQGVLSLNDVLYFTKLPGIYSTQDNFDDPNTWQVIQIEGGVGSSFHGIASITSSQPSLTISNLAVFADYAGLFVFNGVIQHPALTWKIEDIWKRVNRAAWSQITVVANVIDRILYCLVPLDNDVIPSLLLVATMTDGIDYQSVKWSIYDLPAPPRSIGVANFQDSINWLYTLRIGYDASGLDRLDPTAIDDKGTAITSYWQSSLYGYDSGKVHVFRALNLNIDGTVIEVSVGAQDGQRVQVMNSFTAAITPGQDFTRQINYTSEKMAFKLLSTCWWRLDRIDLYGKVQFDTRPLGA